MIASQENILKGPFLVNFQTQQIINGLSPFRKKWSIIVFLAFKDNKIKTFKNLQTTFSISPSILSSTLKELTLEKFVSRKVYGSIPPMKVEYRITPHGKKLLAVISELIALIHESKN